MLAIGSIMLPSFASHPDHSPYDTNPCTGRETSTGGAKPDHARLTNADGSASVVPGLTDDDGYIDGYFSNRNCAEMIDTGYGVKLPQAGMDVTKDDDYGDIADPTGEGGIYHPIMGDYDKQEKPLCPVNVHWHLGTEHRSAGQYDEGGNGPYPNWNEDSHVVHGPGDAASDGTRTDGTYTGDPAGRRLAAAGTKPRQGGMCYHYNTFTDAEKTDYEWKYCKDMHVGNTYEIHWPHSAVGECGKDWFTKGVPGKWQYQYPFYDGVFCNAAWTADTISVGNGDPTDPTNTFNVNKRVGVQGQVYTIINSDEPKYQNDRLFYGAWMGEGHWSDVATYIGSTTGTSRDNEVCSMFSPITWQVDRKCHVISARSWDEMCRIMLHEQADDLEADVHPHGSRKLVAGEFSSDTIYRRE